MGAHISVVGRQRNESCNVKELLLDQERMVLLFKNIAQHSREMRFKLFRNRISLEAILFYFQNSGDDFVTVNFLPANLDAGSIYVLISACFYYVAKQVNDSQWCRPKYQRTHNLLFGEFYKLMIALFHFSHLFEIFVAISGDVCGQRVLRGQFMRAKDSVLAAPGIACQREVSLEEWRGAYLAMKVGSDDDSDSVCFREACQYVVNEVGTPEQYLEHYRADPAVDRSWHPPRYDPRGRHTTDPSYRLATLRAPLLTPLVKPATLSKHRPQHASEDAIAVEDSIECRQNSSPRKIHSVPAPRVSPRNSSAPPAALRALGALPREKVNDHLHLVPEVLSRDCHSENHRHTEERVHDSVVVLMSEESLSASIVPRGTLRPASAPPPLQEQQPPPLCVRPVQCTVFNGRSILSTKQARKKKYNVLRLYKLDPDAESSLTPRVDMVPQRAPLHKTQVHDQLRGESRRQLAPTMHQFSVTGSGGGGGGGSYYSTAEGSRTTLHLKVPVQGSIVSLGEQRSLCMSMAIDDCVDLCEMSMSGTFDLASPGQREMSVHREEEEEEFIFSRV